MPDDASIIRWELVQIPSATEFAVQHGRRIQIDRLPAKFAVVAHGCDSGAGTSVSAAIKASRNRYDYSFVSMSACVGPNAPRCDVAAIRGMVITAHVGKI